MNCELGESSSRSCESLDKTHLDIAYSRQRCSAARSSGDAAGHRLSNPSDPYALGSIESIEQLETIAIEIHETQAVPGEGRRSSRCALAVRTPHPDVHRRGPRDRRRQPGEALRRAAGQLLTKMIIAMGLSREYVYIANMLKCRPPENRHPQPDELQACRPTWSGRSSSSAARERRPREVCAAEPHRATMYLIS